MNPSLAILQETARRNGTLPGLREAGPPPPAIRKGKQALPSPTRRDRPVSTVAFFRDPNTLEALKKEVFPILVRKRQQGLPIRLWVPGCSTGEGVYTMMICLAEYLQAESPAVRVQAFATDLNETAIATARRGIYAETIASQLPPERLRRFFTMTEHGYQINRIIRDAIIFGRHDVTRHPPYSHLDLVSCGNLLNSLAPVSQKRVLEAFHYAIAPTGFLVLGSSTPVGEFSEYFAPFDGNSHIYTKRARPPWWVADHKFNKPLRGLRENRETAQEEFRFNFKKYLSTPTKMPSSIEELVAIREELQSTTEELATLDEELRDRIEELTLESQQRRQAEDRLQLSIRRIRAQDEERQRVSRELHDTTGATLTGLIMSIAAAQRSAEKLDEAVCAPLRESMALARQCAEEVRTLAYQLHPPLLEEAGLRAALNGYLESYSRLSGIQVRTVLPASLGRLPRDMEISLFRIVQEALVNIHRHSRSREAEIQLGLNADAVTLQVRDRGQGMAKDAHEGLGIRGIRERAQLLKGCLEIVSNGQGTTLKVALPLWQPASAAHQKVPLAKFCLSELR